jgi:putative transcriptional regulator
MSWRRSGVGLLLVLALQLLAPALGAEQTMPPGGESLAGRLLIAAPDMPDPRFAESVILLVRHDAMGAWGLVVNRPIGAKPAGQILSRLLGEEFDGEAGREVRIHWGGPVAPLQPSFLHTPDFEGEETLPVAKGISLTRGFDLLQALADGAGPSRAFLLLGYAGWGPGQLDDEVRRRDWIAVAPDDEIVFDDDMADKWRRALALQSVDL